mmetsp:Transcript_46614/g.72968  ORF Transcript_46614/g.72968 Transcript_46614/m.72968 type:complete len:296 (+) Transcript_46614:204-1091(+)|eukprot:CAMPEP_0184310690 /NCGR_PEP_ID=MMETSP1049-20130417/33696_1 /TAXON_ID=77928 /ORGANISM="Proteomonas sulcata, Strain CCMP704" /LENGTH=295 /DNA_ID=CAMNT_0026625219 /DNA_START=151 /DNA_END=1038 /DNA_ORIENTATION=+
MTAPTLAVFPRRKTGQTKKAGPRTPVVITLDILKSCFHLPMPTASAKLGICTTAIKKLCRKFGIKKWPYRTLMSTSRRSKTSNFEDLMTAIEKNTLKNDPHADPVKTAQEIRKNFSLEIMQNKAKYDEEMLKEDSGVVALLKASREAGLQEGLNRSSLSADAEQKEDAQPREHSPSHEIATRDAAVRAQAHPVSGKEAENLLMQQSLLAKQLPHLQLQQLAQLQHLQSLQQMFALQALAAQDPAALQLAALQQQLGGMAGLPGGGLDANALALAQAQLQAAAAMQQGNLPMMNVK